MTNHIRIIYLYIIAFITLTMIVGGISATIYNISNYIFPTSYVFFEEYETKENSSYSYSLDDEISSVQKTSIKKQNYKRQKIKDSIVSIVVVIVGTIMYKYHWNIIEKEKQ